MEIYTPFKIQQFYQPYHFESRKNLNASDTGKVFNVNNTLQANLILSTCEM